LAGFCAYADDILFWCEGDTQREDRWSLLEGAYSRAVKTILGCSILTNAGHTKRLLDVPELTTAHGNVDTSPPVALDSHDYHPYLIITFVSIITHHFAFGDVPGYFPST
ncbi:hypothetical protein FOZ60_000517, partial [Perkinsus olseni]